MKKRYLYVLVFLLLILPVCAETKEIFSDQVEDGKTYTLSNGEILEVAYLYGEDKLFLETDHFSTILSIDTCSVVNNYDVCFLSTSLGDFNSSVPGERIILSDITINQVVPTIELGTSIDKTLLSIGENTNFNITLSNTENIDINDVEFVINTSTNFDSVLTTTDCQKKGGVISWEGNIRGLGDRSCSFIIQSKKPGNGLFSVKVYVNDAEVASSQTTVVTKPYSLNISGELKNNTVRVGDQQELLLNASTSNNLKVNWIELRFPPSIQVINSSENLRSERIYSYTKDFESGDSHILRFNFYPIRTGNSTIRLIANYFSDDYKEQYEINYELESILEEHPTPRFQRRFYSNGENNVRVIVANPTQVVFKDIEVDIISRLNFANTKASFEEIGKRSHKEFSTSFDVQNINETVNITLKYESVYGEEFTKLFPINISVSDYSEEEISELESANTEASVAEEPIFPEREPIEAPQTAPELFGLNLSKINATGIALVIVISVIIIMIPVILLVMKSKKEEI